MRLAALPLMLLLLACPGSEPVSRMHQRWHALGVPSDRLTLVLAESDEHGFFANYRGYEATQLLGIVSGRLEAAGYEFVGATLEGRARAYRRALDEVCVKVDLLGPEVGLSVFDAESKEHLLHGVCFGRYTLGPPERIR